jgi:outer membrane protein TolC
MRLSLSVGLLLAIPFAAPPARAATPLTLAEAESRAEAANPRLASFRLDAVAAAQRASQARARHFGQVDGVASYNRYESARLVRPISIELFEDPAAGMSQLPWDDIQTHFGLAFQLPLLAGGTLREGSRSAALARSAAEKTALFVRDEVRTSVRAAYRNALLARHALAASRQYEEALKKDERDALLKVSLGSAAPVDASKLTWALRGAEAQVADIAAQERTAQAYLAALMGEEPPPDGWDLTESPDEPQVAAPAGESGLISAAAPDDALAEALAGRADLSAVRDATRISESRRRLATDSFGPRLALEGNVFWNRAPSVSGSLETHEVALTLRLPIFDGLGRIHAVREADANLAAAREREKGKELEVAAQVVAARGRLEAAHAQLAAGRAQRELGREVARVERLRLDQGTGKVEDYLAARSQELQGETSYWRALYALQGAEDEMEFVTAKRTGETR